MFVFYPDRKLSIECNELCLQRVYRLGWGTTSISPRKLVQFVDKCTGAISCSFNCATQYTHIRSTPRNREKYVDIHCLTPNCGGIYTCYYKLRCTGDKEKPIQFVWTRFGAGKIWLQTEGVHNHGKPFVFFDRKSPLDSPPVSKKLN